MENNLSKLLNRKFIFSKHKCCHTFAEYNEFCIQPSRKYRNSKKDKLLQFFVIRFFAFLRAYLKVRFSNIKEQLKCWQKHFVDNINDYQTFYTSLADEESKRVMYKVIEGCFTGNFRPAQSKNDFYFDNDIIKFSEKEVFVDCGAYFGDSTDLFITKNPNQSIIYVIEPDPNNMDSAIRNIKKNINYCNNEVIFVKKGISDKKEKLYFNQLDSGGSFSENSSENTLELELDTLDSILQHKATFIKMDLEGFEEKALLGAQNQISNNLPKLALSIYHKPEDWIVLPNLIKKLDKTNSYKYYLRHYSPFHNETVLFAIPSNKSI